MKIFMYSVLDKKADEFGPPFMAKNDEVAKRNLSNLLRDSPYPEDYQLFLIAEYESDTGEVQGLVPMEVKGE